MARKSTKKQYVVGQHNKVRTDMYKPLYNYCLEWNQELNKEAKAKGIKKKIPIIYVQVEILKRLKEK